MSRIPTSYLQWLRATCVGTIRMIDIALKYREVKYPYYGDQENPVHVDCPVCGKTIPFEDWDAHMAIHPAYHPNGEL